MNRSNLGCTTRDSRDKMGNMELLHPVDEFSESLATHPKVPGESGQPQQIDDDTQRVAKMLGRQNATYDHVWETVEKVYPQWQPVLCNSLRRAILLASSATQHRSMAMDVRRRGRLVCLRLLTERDSVANKTHARPATLSA